MFMSGEATHPPTHETGVLSSQNFPTLSSGRHFRMRRTHPKPKGSNRDLFPYICLEILRVPVTAARNYRIISWIPGFVSVVPSIKTPSVVVDRGFNKGLRSAEGTRAKGSCPSYD